MIRIGNGFDVHQLVEGRKCIIGGVTIPYEKGLLGTPMRMCCCTRLATRSWAHWDSEISGSISRIHTAAFKDADSLILIEASMAISEGEGYQLGECGFYDYCSKAQNGFPTSQQMVEIIAAALEQMQIK